MRTLNLDLTDAQLLRGVPMDKMLACGGKILADNKGSLLMGTAQQYMEIENPYEQSEVVSELAYFLSHSWRDHGLLKAFVLLYSKNRIVALVGACLAALPCVLLTFLGVFPTVSTRFSGDYLQNGPATLVWLFIYLVLLFFAHKLPFSSKDHVFLDKACICQTDEAQKLAGIRSLGAFLKRTRTMLACAGEDYFSRLWCNYELAVFMKLVGMQNIDIVPIQAPVVSFFTIISQTACCLSVYDTHGHGQAPAGKCVTFLLFVVTNYLVVDLLVTRKTCSETMGAFSVKDAQCFCCSVDHSIDGCSIPCDRVLVEEHIVELFGTTEAFDEHVRVDLNQAMKKRMGPEWLVLSPLDLFCTWVITLLFCVEGVLWEPYIPLWLRCRKLAMVPTYRAPNVLFAALSASFVCKFAFYFVPVGALKATHAKVCFCATLGFISFVLFVTVMTVVYSVEVDPHTSAAAFWPLLVTPPTLCLFAYFCT